ncbi:conserved exported hypothetical protein [Luteimonas sp. 9C]|uniref:FecR family protein n=1 Tax=Luteimonas sp. 9C TaxID=2653148 RepID=UPI0012F444B0|nr:FecR family protein [Luteimonas sp. 9C]VXB33267.1 conserved exported hypothetical protein [Luteimonas sp. 9C]
MSKIWALLAAVGLACSAWTVAAADQHVGLMKAVSGGVSIVQASATRAAEAGTQLQIADRIVTAPGATASIVFRDGTMLTLGGGADVHVRDYVFEPKANRYAFSVYMGQGSAIYESGKIGRLAPESVQVETPQATVGVRGTRFLIEAN